MTQAKSTLSIAPLLLATLAIGCDGLFGQEQAPPPPKAAEPPAAELTALPVEDSQNEKLAALKAELEATKAELEEAKKDEGEAAPAIAKPPKVKSAQKPNAEPAPTSKAEPKPPNGATAPSKARTQPSPAPGTVALDAATVQKTLNAATDLASAVSKTISEQNIQLRPIPGLTAPKDGAPKDGAPKDGTEAPSPPTDPDGKDAN